MPKSFQLNIPEPCHESWDQMHPSAAGRFCDSCQKEVVDFSRMNDEQMIAFFRRKAEGSVCGRLNGDQMHRDLFIPKKRIPWLKYFFTVALPAMLYSSKASAQGKIVGDTVTVARIALPGKVAVQATSIESKHIIDGQVLDENANGIPFATVMIKGTTTGVATDDKGMFRIDYKGKSKKIVLLASSVGYSSSEISIDVNGSSSSCIIHAIPLTTQLQGEVVIVAGMIGVEKPKKAKKKSIPSLTRTIMDSISNKFKIFPNPVHSGSSLNIEINNLEEAYYRVDLSSIDGPIVYQKEIWIDKDARVFDFDIPALTPGNYVLALVNRDTGKRLTQKLVVN